MKSETNYSIIIPHKNVPKLLQRCLNSIPLRDDIQIIVVDDNSDSSIVDFTAFPGIDRKDVEVIFTTEGKGAGYARNIGLSKAKGKWLIFIDSDDYFASDINDILDQNLHYSEDFIIYDFMTVMSDNLSIKSNRSSQYHAVFHNFLSAEKKEEIIRFNFQPMWGKIIRRSLVEDNHIRFREVKWSNDVYFSAQIGCFANSIKICNHIFIIITQRAGSLTSNFCQTKYEFTTRLTEAIRAEKLIHMHGSYPSPLQSYGLINYVRSK